MVASLIECFEALLAEPRGRPLALLHGGGDDGGPTWLCTEPVETLTVAAGDVRGAWERLDAFLQRHRQRRSVGWLGYDLALDIESWPLRAAEDDFPVPVLHLAAYERVREYAGSSVGQPRDVPAATRVAAHVSQQDYERRVAQVVEHIRNGDIFQANLTQPFTAEFDGDPRALFWRLCSESPAPFAAYIEDGSGTAVLSSSPEEFLRQHGRTVRTQPIKGTRPRGATPAEDAALLQELLVSEKDQAELAMIIDLLRNDLGKVAETGSVRVGPFPEHASFAQVHHLFANVEATLRADISTVDLLRATFPGGSITGCPKLRCLEIIEQLEVARRGVYTGAIGWFGPGDHMHLNIAIRTLVHRSMPSGGGLLRGNAGGGVTALSDPHLEWRESLAKMAGLLQALQAPVSLPGLGLPDVILPEGLAGARVRQQPKPSPRDGGGAKPGCEE